MFVNDVAAEKATKGDRVTMKLDFRIRPSDKLYKIVKTEVAQANGGNYITKKQMYWL